MLHRFLNSLEDPDSPYLGPSYWILKRMGLMLPENRIARIAYIILHEIVSFFVLTQYMELYVIRSDLDLVLTNLKISMLSIVCIVKANTFVFWQVSWKEVIQYVTEADKYERVTRDAVKGKIIDTYTKYCRRVLYFYWILVFTTFVTVITTPLVRYLSSESYREALLTGAELFPHIFSSWMPFDKYHSPGCWITVLWHILLCAYGAGIMAAYDTSIVVIMVFFGGKLELLRERCKQMFGSNGLGVSEEDAWKIIGELHNTHVLLKKYSRLFNSLLSPVMFLYVVMCSLMLCASAYQLTTAQNATQTFLMAEYLIFGVAQLFMFCWHSNDVLVKSEQAMLGPYESQWWAGGARRGALLLAGQLRLVHTYTAGPFTDLTLSTFITSKQATLGPYESQWWAGGARRGALLLVGQLRLVHPYTAGPFTDLTLSTFITILKGAYSYYTLLRK